MMCVPDVMQSYLHLYQASGARVSGAITNPQDLLKGNPVLVCASALFRLWEACCGFLGWTKLGKVGPQIC